MANRSKGGGTPCGASFISPKKECKVGTSKILSTKQLRSSSNEELSKLLETASPGIQRDKVKEELSRRGREDDVKKTTEEVKKSLFPSPVPVAPPPVMFLSQGAKMAILEAKKIDKDLEKEELQREGDKGFDKWEDSLGKEAPVLGRGMFGSVAKSKDGTYAVKRGDVSDNEVSVIGKIGEKDLGPSLVAADLDGPGSQTVPGVNIRKGRIAMTIVPGLPLGLDTEPELEVNGVKVSDSYWKARADLHRMGIAHNDMHVGNILVDNKGKGRFVDLGLAQESPKAALSEALGAFQPPPDATIKKSPKRKVERGDWQVQQYEATAGPLILEAQKSGKTKQLGEKAPHAARALKNLSELEKRMEADGFTRDEIGMMRLYGIRNDPSVFTKGVWKKLSDEQSMDYINILYDGI